jgi:hypothetical protein
MNKKTIKKEYLILLPIIGLFITNQAVPVTTGEFVFNKQNSITCARGVGAALATGAAALLSCKWASDLLSDAQKKQLTVASSISCISLAAVTAYTARQIAPYSRQALLKPVDPYNDKRVYQEPKKALAYSSLITLLLGGATYGIIRDRSFSNRDPLGIIMAITSVGCTAYACYDLMPNIYTNIKPLAQTAFQRAKNWWSRK